MPRAVTPNGVIEQAYDCIVEEHRWDELLASYAQLVGADSGLMYLRPRLGGAGKAIASVNYDLSSSGLKRYLSYYEARSPVHAMYRELPEAAIRAVGAFAFSTDFRERNSIKIGRGRRGMRICWAPIWSAHRNSTHG